SDRENSSVDGRYVFPVRDGEVLAYKYVALGDSFQSGEGAYAYEPGTDQDGNYCHRSYNAYPHLIQQSGDVTLTLDFRACSGAVIDDLSRANQGEAPQVGALGDDVRLVTVGIGGNDAGFANTVQNCVVENGWQFIKPPHWAWMMSPCQASNGDDVEAA